MANRYVEFEPHAQDTQDAATSLKDKAMETAGRAQEKAQEARRNLENKLDQSRASAAERLHGAASALHRKADNLPGGETAANWAHSAADRMHTTADYIREHGVRDMMGEVKAFVRRHPGGSLVGALVVGFFIARRFRSDE